MADVKPFRAVRYDPEQVASLDSVIAPPYDVISAEDRDRYLGVPHNVVHLTLPDDEQVAGALWREWLEEGVLVHDDEPALWWLAQDYVGPDGLERHRDGLAVALRAEPYGEGGVLPHERTHAGPKEGRLRLLRAVRAHVEPIFLLYEGALAAPGGEPAIDVTLDGVRSRLWRVPGEPPSELEDATLLIADGHHRYETAVAFREQEGTEESAWLLAVVVPTEQEGLTIFPTHRIAAHIEELPPLEEGELDDDARATAYVYTRNDSGLLRGERGELDTELVARYAPEVRYTAHADEARAAVDSGEAEAAFLLRAPSVEQVAAVARAGKTMPQKSTYFFPKLPSGALFLPLDD